MKKKTAIIWLRQCFRLSDNWVLKQAMDSAEEIIPLFIWDPDAEGKWSIGSASKWWLRYSLKSLDKELKSRKNSLVIRSGDTLKVLQEVVNESKADLIIFDNRFEPELRKLENAVFDIFKHSETQVTGINASLLIQPELLLNQQQKPYQVFTPFYKTCQQFNFSHALWEPPYQINPHSKTIQSQSIEDLKLLPEIPWAETIEKSWTPGEVGAKKTLEKFSIQAVNHYSDFRDHPDEEGVSFLSPHLHFGEISPLRILNRLQDNPNAEPYIRQLFWREFSHYLLFHFPTMTDKPLKRIFDEFPWEKNDQLFKLWQRGQTGYPLVDAGMRELWETGWMHNRVRMVAASFLVKHLLIPWQSGAEWFWDTLVDADLANNTMGWQWVAGCGADAAPYFRIFNPITQGQKFDPEGNYIRKWVPELSALSPPYIHHPWETPEDILRSSGITLGKDYPGPIVSHTYARERALKAYEQIKGTVQSK